MRVSIDPGAETVSGDRDRLEQALQNLAANAIRYAPRGSSVRLASRLEAAADPGAPGGLSGRADLASMLSVEDEGAAGISPEHLPHVFDRFYKADASRVGVSGGSGLGLSIVKAIVERHGGRISISSRPGRTVFEVVLPQRTLA
jgi:two-component system OmpR family sensor kinase